MKSIKSIGDIEYITTELGVPEEFLVMGEQRTLSSVRLTPQLEKMRSVIEKVYGVKQSTVVARGIALITHMYLMDTNFPTTEFFSNELLEGKRLMSPVTFSYPPDLRAAVDLVAEEREVRPSRIHLEGAALMSTVYLNHAIGVALEEGRGDRVWEAITGS
jgi:hypothetical protein